MARIQLPPYLGIVTGKISDEYYLTYNRRTGRQYIRRMPRKKEPKGSGECG